MTLPDIQNTNPNINIPIKQVGVENVEIPFSIQSKYGPEFSSGFYDLVCNVSVRCSLDQYTKGISMSRCIRTLKNYMNKPLKQTLIKDLCANLRNELESTNIFVKFKFKLPIFRKSIESDNIFPVYYNSLFEGQLLNDGSFEFFQGMRVQYASYCPCSAELSKKLVECGLNGFPHNQRSFANIIIKTSRETGYVWLEDINEVVENVIKTLPYAIIKREDEQKIAEIASNNPLFVEDAIRLISNSLDNRNDILDWYVKCVHQESIHTSEAISINYKGVKNGLSNLIDLFT